MFLQVKKARTTTTKKHPAVITREQGTKKTECFQLWGQKNLKATVFTSEQSIKNECIRS